MNFEKHRAMFASPECARPGEWRGKKPLSWARSIGCNEEGLEQLPDQYLTREALRDFLNKDHPRPIRAIAVLAWGGMNSRNGKLLLQNRSLFLKKLEELRECKNHFQAYDVFYFDWENNKQKGLGAAYFTKLIYFLRPELGGYIMDQWVAKSVNMLFPEPCVHIRSGTSKSKRAGKEDQVSKFNDASRYGEFCKRIKDLADEFTNSNVEDCEQRLFSKGGLNPDHWRRYVHANWSGIENNLNFTD